MHAGDRGEDRLCVEPGVVRGALEFERQNIQQDFGVGVGVDMTKIELEELAFERLAVGQVAVVRERDPERRIHIERLRFELRRRASRGGIAAVPDAKVARQIAHVARPEYVPDVAAGLVHMKRRAVVGDDAGGILPAMLEQKQPVIEHLIDRRVRDDAYDSTHEQYSPVDPHTPREAMSATRRGGPRALLRRAESVPGAEKSSRSAHARGKYGFNDNAISPNG